MTQTNAELGSIMPDVPALRVAPFKPYFLSERLGALSAALSVWLNRHQLDFKDQSGVWLDVGNPPALANAKVRRNEELHRAHGLNCNARSTFYNTMTGTWRVTAFEGAVRSFPLMSFPL